MSDMGELYGMKGDFENVPRYKMIIEYDGTSYSGWQGQANARSIQGTLIETARRVLNCEADIQGRPHRRRGPRWDRWLTWRSRKTVPPCRPAKWNDELPSNINILRLEEAKADFHARHHAKAEVICTFFPVNEPLSGNVMSGGCRIPGHENHGNGDEPVPGFPRFFLLRRQKDGKGKISWCRSIPPW